MNALTPTNRGRAKYARSQAPHPQAFPAETNPRLRTDPHQGESSNSIGGNSHPRFQLFVFKPLMMLFVFLLGVSRAFAQDPSGQVYFETDMDRPLSGSLERLDPLVTAAKECVDCRVILFGHTDARGSDKYNNALSRRRAWAVYTYLVSRGLDKERIELDYRGERLPVATNDNEEGMALNRRVEVKVEGYAAFAAAQSQEVSDPNSLDPSAFDRFLEENSRMGAETWTIDPREDFSVRSREGAVISVRAGTFEGTEEITLTFYSALSYGGMFLHRMSTHTQGGDVLESAGMFRFEATRPDGKQVAFAEGRNIGVWLPRPEYTPLAEGEEEPTYFAFEGHPDGDWHSWSLSSQNVGGAGGSMQALPGIGRRVLTPPDVCTQVIDRVPYPFWRRLRIWVGNQFRSIDGQIATYSNTVRQECDSTEWKKWRKQLDEITGLDERTKDILAGEPGRLMAADMDYMPMVVGGFNWVNCDAFSGMRPMVSVTVETPSEPNTRCMLLYRQRRIALGGVVGDGNYHIPQAPGGYEATLLVVRFREEYVEVSDELVKVERRMHPGEFRKMSHAEFLQYIGDLGEIS